MALGKRERGKKKGGGGGGACNEIAQSKYFTIKAG